MIGVLEQVLAKLALAQQANDAAARDRDLYSLVPSGIMAQPKGLPPTPYREPMQGGPEPPTGRLNIMARRLP